MVGFSTLETRFKNKILAKIAKNVIIKKLHFKIIYHGKKMDPIKQFVTFFTEELKQKSSTKTEDPCDSVLNDFKEEKQRINESKNTIPVKETNIDRAYRNFSSKCKDRK